MTDFIISYLIIAIMLIIGVFFLSLYEEKHKAFKSLLLVIYIVAILGILFATGCLEVKYSMSRIYSTSIAAAIVLMLYFADTFGGKMRKE